MNRALVQRHLQLADSASSTEATRIASLPGVTHATIDEDRLMLAYDLRETELSILLQQIVGFGLNFSQFTVARLRRWLICWQDHNCHRHLRDGKGWPYYLQQAYLESAAGNRADIRPERWRRYLTRKPVTGP